GPASARPAGRRRRRAGVAPSSSRCPPGSSERAETPPPAAFRSEPPEPAPKAGNRLVTGGVAHCYAGTNAGTTWGESSVGPTAQRRGPGPRPHRGARHEGPRDRLPDAEKTGGG